VKTRCLKKNGKKIAKCKLWFHGRNLMYSNANAENTKPDLVSQVRLDVKNIVLHMETKGKKIDSSFVCFLDVKHMKFHK